MDAQKFYQVWSDRFVRMFETIKAQKIKYPQNNAVLRAVCKDFTDGLQLKIEGKNLKRHLELEAIQAQNAMTTRLNKRLRQELEEYEDQTSSQESGQTQCTYDPDSESSEDTENILEPMWQLDSINLSKILSQFRVKCYKKHLYQE
ncbi:hypothetical protein BD770DRAFT_385659 [Pilaira anomala]|nr:hypothetical protein BD770DRAFT_385659 [Pilaira anomala]